MIEKTSFGEVQKFTLLGDGDLQAEIITYGAAIRALRFKPRYGCGKCQLAVPCETRVPQK